jgi:CubicO group peptidase (beta-lactamase class C family)
MRECSSEYKREVELHRLSSYLEKKHIFSGVLLLAEDGIPVFTRAFGRANEDQLNSIDSIFEIASVSKSMTALGIMLLVDEGRLSLETTINELFEELTYEVSIYQLMTHTSGLADYMEWFENPSNWDSGKVALNRDVFKFLKIEKPDLLFQPGEKWDYCNTGYVLLALIIEKLSKLSYSAFMDSRILKPLGMTDTSTYSQFLDDELIGFSRGHIYDRDKAEYYKPEMLDEHRYVYFLDGVKGDGGIKSTAADLLKWEQAFYGKKLVKEETLDRIFLPTVLKDGTSTGFSPGLHKPYGSYGLGWKLEKDKEYGSVVLHDGYWAGYCSALVRYPDGNKTMIILSNSEFTKAELNAIPHMLSLELEKILFGGEFDKEEFEKLIHA